jgi:OST3 / OST6 family, transporter family
MIKNVVALTLIIVLIMACDAVEAKKKKGAAKKPSGEEKRAAQAQNWRNFSSKMSQTNAVGKLWRMSDGELEQAAGAPRNYSYVVLGIVSRRECPYCIKFKDIVERVLYYYNAQLGESDGVAQRKLGFVEIDMDTCQECFQQFQATNVPYIGLTRRTKSLRSSLAVGESDVYPMSIDAVSEAFMLNWIREHAKIEIEPRYTVAERSLMAFGALLVLFIAVRMTPVFLRHWSSPQLWFVGSLMVFGFSLSGVVYNLLHAPEPYHYDPRSGETSYFQGGMRSQYGYEGFIVAILHIGASVSLILLATIIPALSGAKQQIAFVLLAPLAFITFNGIAEAFTNKMGGGYEYAPHIPLHQLRQPFSSFLSN